ncbi:MAG: acetate--CoA ligase family protein [Thermoleophilia bacterium]
MTESEAKGLLASYGVPVVEGEEVSTVEEAVSAARRLGFPVVLKALSSTVLHKSEAGLVLVGPDSEAAVRRGFSVLEQRAGEALEGILVERMVSARRELVAGMVRDPQFGPAVMFGIGGVLTEAVDDVGFALAPLEQAEAEALLDSIRSRRLLGDFRGEPALDRERMAGILCTLGRLAEEIPEIQEIDCNPVLVEGGLPIVADALISLAEPQPGLTPVSPDLDLLDAVFAPQSVAVVGASSTVTKWGGTIMVNVLSGGYSGRIYPVNPSGGRILGLETYGSVQDLPEAPDLALVSVPAAQVRSVVEACGRKGTRAVVVITAGFSEVGAEGAREEEAVAAVAREYGMALVGPNCMGVISSASRFYATGAVVLRPEPGPAAFISQSGNMGIQLMASAEQRRGGIGKFVGVGNQAAVRTGDFIEYFRRDPQTEVILTYLESVEDGRRLFETARRAAAEKPVVVLRGGLSEYGGRAASSHTGALAGSARVFAGAARQAGVLVTHDPDDFLDLAFALSYLPVPRGRRAAIVTMGGGWGVLSADEAERSGLLLARLGEETLSRLDGVLPSFWNRDNPLDLVGTTTEGVAETVVETVARSPEVDVVVVLGVVGMMTTPIRIEEEAAKLEEARNPRPGAASAGREQPDLQRYCLREEGFMRRTAELMEECGKPIINVSFTPMEQAVFDYGSRYRTLVLPSPLRAVRVAAHMGRYGEYLSGLRTSGALESSQTEKRGRLA